MKSVLKFVLLAALIVGGKLVKKPNQVVNKQTVEVKNIVSVAPVVLVHQVLTSEPVTPARKEAQPQQSGNGLITEMF